MTEAYPVVADQQEDGGAGYQLKVLIFHTFRFKATPLSVISSASSLVRDTDEDEDEETDEETKSCSWQVGESDIFF